MNYLIWNLLNEVGNAGALAALGELSMAEKELAEAGIRTGDCWDAAQYIQAARQGDGMKQSQISSRAWEDMQVAYRYIAADGVDGSGVEDRQEWVAALRRFDAQR